MANPVSAEDYAAILNLMGIYQHLVDDGDADGWADLFTEDGAFLGFPGEDFVGREALRRIPQINLTRFGGGFRHNLCSFGACYGGTRDEAVARYYMIGTVTASGAGTTVAMQVDVTTQLVRVDGQWKIRSNRMAML
jgi:ketosteroid isomerase-like protein